MSDDDRPRRIVIARAFAELHGVQTAAPKRVSTPFVEALRDTLDDAVIASTAAKLDPTIDPKVVEWCEGMVRDIRACLAHEIAKAS